MTALALFASTFLLVLLLGLQSLNVNGRHYALAVVTSVGISGAQLVMFKIVPGETTPIDLIGYFSGGPLGISAAIWLHPYLVRLLRR